MSLNNADKDILNRAIQEFNGSLTRAAAERDLQKGICDRVKDCTGIEPKQTRALAKLFYNQDKEEKEAEFDDIIGLYELVCVPDSKEG